VWLEATGARRGYVASVQTMFDLSKDWYDGRFDDDWDPPTAEQAEATFASHGLTGDFWRLS